MNKMIDNLVRYSQVPTEKNISDYPTIIDIMEELAKEEEKESCLDPLLRHALSPMEHKGKFFVMKSSNQENVCLIPTGKSNKLFRGQNRYYEECKSTLYRSVSDENLLHSYLQIEELKILLESHPIINDLIYNKFYHPKISEPIKFSVDYQGLAQHYGIATDMLDFTRDKWTAAFFATSINEDGKYRPVDPEKGGYIYGVLYVSDDVFNENLQPIGLNYFNRPGVQEAYVYHLKQQEDLNLKSDIRKMFFRHDYKSSFTVFSMNQQGKALFPQDSLVDMVKNITQNKIYSLIASVKCKASHYSHLSNDEYNDLLQSYNIKIQTKPLKYFSEKDISMEWQKWQQVGEARYLSSLYILPTFNIDK
jgi:hypothetical protein